MVGARLTSSLNIVAKFDIFSDHKAVRSYFYKLCEPTCYAISLLMGSTCLKGTKIFSSSINNKCFACFHPIEPCKPQVKSFCLIYFDSLPHYLYSPKPFDVINNAPKCSVSLNLLYSSEEFTLHACCLVSC